VEVSEMVTLLLKPEQAFPELGISRAKGYQMLASGELPAVRLGRAVRIPREALEQWVRARTEGAQSSGEQATAVG